MRFACSSILALCLATPALFAQDGATLYKQRCASCHDAPQGRVPAIGAIRQMTGEAIYGVLSNGVMKPQAEGLSTTELIKLIAYIAPTGGAPARPAYEKTCSADAPFTIKTAQVWGGWSPGLANSRFQSAVAAGLPVADVPKLNLKWAFNLGSVTISRGQPAVAANRVFVATQAGDVYALDVETGCTYWGFKARRAIRSGVAVGDAHGVPAIFFGDSSATMYAVNAATGELLWKTRPVEHLMAVSTATPQVYKGVVYQGFTSIEEALAGDPHFVCCTFRGSVVALDAATGSKLWETFTISETPEPARHGSQIGPSGAAVWSTPTIDEKLGIVYVATGDNYSNPATETSDSVLALDLKTGKLLWSRQLVNGDAYNVGCSTPARTNCAGEDGPDFDFGQPPILVQLDAAHRALVIAQKSGIVHALDPDQRGSILWQKRVSQGGKLGGSQWGSATDDANIYVAISDAAVNGVADSKAPGGYRLALDPNKGGGLYALNLKSGEIAWSAKPAVCPPTQATCSPAQSAAVTAIPGAVFSGALDGHMRAYSTKDGSVIWDFDTVREFSTVNGRPAHGGSIDATGAAVVGGKVFVTSGYNQWGGLPGNVLLVFSADGK